ncbi:MAG: hypothetical protein AB7E47_00630 [Desulfovibrionaceae bacterium]
MACKDRKLGRMLTVGMACIVVFGLVCLTVRQGQTAASPGIGNDQCVVCHPQEPATIAMSGGLHKTNVGCQDCHTEHPPQGKNAIPKCSVCHSGKAHYELENCSKCHANTHAPRDIAFSEDYTAPCVTCHPQQGDEVAKHPSRHAELPCTQCHTKHREIPSCLDCHEKHTPDMDLASCTSCHPVHMPLDVTYSKDTPSRYCASCHDNASKILSHNTTKHHDLSCVFCHRDQHKMIPPCFACHPQVHPESMLKKFSGCGECHSSAHDVRR